ncbi:uncharacterized protein LOC131331009 [Rhododendron vialii]|uniref:uncharacterized protein LOC131331009 n=1 Tax=Rhododendron vialii TaxID=182163 RepID=UPI00265DEC01|nr:uncharacterized protein LOC131331009 [Rhododendron vialii]
MAEQKSMREHMHLERTTPLRPIVLPTETVEARNAFTIKLGIHNALLLFYGSENEDPADKWLRMHKAQSFTTWAIVRDLFYERYFSEGGRVIFKVLGVFQGLLVVLIAPWFARHQLVSFFYLDLNVAIAQQIEYLRKEENFLDKFSDDAWDSLEELAEKHRSWEPSDLANTAMAAQGPSSSGVFSLSMREYNVQSQLDKMFKQLENLKLMQVQQVNEVRVEEMCALCECPGHSVTDCPSGPTTHFWVGEIKKSQCNPKHHLNSKFSSSGPLKSQISITEQTKQAIDDIKTQLTAAVGQVEHERENLEEVRAIITLRSGKEIDKINPLKQKLVLPPELVAAPVVSPDLESVPEEDDEPESPEVEVSAPAAPTTPSPLVVPYLHRLVTKPKANVNFQILELFKKVQFSISLMEAIDVIHQFAKVLKYLCTSKRRTKSQDKVLIMEQVSSIFQADILTKCKDPGCPTIPIAIASQKFNKALLDLGASVNLLPNSVTLQLADPSVRVSKGVVEGVLIQVGEFLFPVDFIVLDTCPILKVFEKTPIILGRPFLGTSNAIMNCKTGQL